MALERERYPLGLCDLQGLPIGAQLELGPDGWVVLAVHGRTADVACVVDLKERHRVEVDDRLQPGHRVRIRVATGGVP